MKFISKFRQTLSGSSEMQILFKLITRGIPRQWGNHRLFFKDEFVITATIRRYTHTRENSVHLKPIRVKSTGHLDIAI